MGSSYDAVVIGSGFGGAVSACRLAQAEQSVLILERGRRYPRNSYPRNDHNLKEGWLVLPRYGHIDTFMGRRSNLDTYPEVLQHLERTSA